MSDRTVLTVQAGLTHRLLQTGGLYSSHLISSRLLHVLGDLWALFAGPSNLLWAHGNHSGLLLQVMCLADTHAQACSADTASRVIPPGQGKDSGVSSYLFDLAEMLHNIEDGFDKQKVSVVDMQLEVFQ